MDHTNSYQFEFQREPATILISHVTLKRVMFATIPDLHRPESQETT